MLNFFKRVWYILTYPFRLIWRIISFPFGQIRRFVNFMNLEPSETPVVELIGGIVTDESIRQFIFSEIQAFRKHLLRMMIGLALTVGGSFYFTQPMVEFLARPVGGIEALRAIEVTESIGVFMRVALLSGVILALPYIAFEFWRFAAPGLKPREKKIGLLGIPLSGIFFTGGVAFAYFVLIPAALPFLLNFMGIETQLRPQSYFSFLTGLMFWIGVIFELPLVVYILTSIGLVTPKVLQEQWRLAIVIISVLAAVITPTIDPVNMTLVMAPMTLLYFISIGFSYAAYAGRTKDVAGRSKDQKAKTAAKAKSRKSRPKSG